MRHTAKIVSLIAGVAVMALAGAASATSITWTTTAGNCLSGYTCNSSQASFLGSDGTTVVTAKAWAYNPYTGSIVESNLGIYSPGLGVVSPYDGNHTVDNNGYKDFVAFYFSEEVDINAVYLNTYGDTDMTAWIGTVPGVPSFTGQNVSDLNVNYGASFDNTGGDYNRKAEFGLDAQNGNLLVVAAIGSSTNDSFKIRTLYAESIATEPDDPPPPNTVASPSTLLVFGPAVFGLAAVRRRRARKAAVDNTDQPAV